LEKLHALGIQTALKFTNLKVDGAIVLVDGRRLAVEIKYRMNWTKACKAESEFRRFLQISEATTHPVSGAVRPWLKAQSPPAIKSRTRRGGG
jgi:hypothetical protein